MKTPIAAEDRADWPDSIPKNARAHLVRFAEQIAEAIRSKPTLTTRDMHGDAKRIADMAGELLAALRKFERDYQFYAHEAGTTEAAEASSVALGCDATEGAMFRTGMSSHEFQWPVFGLQAHMQAICSRWPAKSGPNKPWKQVLVAEVDRVFDQLRLCSKERDFKLACSVVFDLAGLRNRSGSAPLDPDNDIEKFFKKSSP